MRRLLRLHSDQRGTLSPMILTATIVLVYMIVWILNTGQTIYDKQRTQDTADAVALVHADWTARSLNIMAMNNVASSQATVIGATSVAFQLTTADFAWRSGQIIKTLAEYMKDWGWGPPSLIPPMPPMPYCPYYQFIVIDFGLIHKACLAFQGFRMTMAAAAIVYVGYTEVHYDPIGLTMKASDIIDAMSAVNDDLVSRLPERISVNAQTLASLNKVDHVAFHPPCHDAGSCNPGREAEGGDLPVRRGVDTQVSTWGEMCIAMEHGTGSYPLPDVPFGPGMRDAYKQRGFPEGEGPLTGGGKGGNPHIRDHVNEETSINSWLRNWQTFYDAFGDAYMSKIPFKQLIGDNLKEEDKFDYTVDLPLVGEVGFDWEDAVDAGVTVLEKVFNLPLGVVNPFQLPIDTPPRYEETQSLTENDFTRTFDDTWDTVCPLGGGVLSAIGALPQPYWLKGRELFAVDPATTRMTGDQIKDFRSLAIVSRAPRARIQPKLFKDASPSAYAFAESWTHNYTAFDLYTQDWRAALAPASRAADPDLVDTLRGSPGASSFEKLATTLDQGGPDGLPALITH